MLRKIVLEAMLLGGMAVGAIAQNLVIKGSVREAESPTKVEFANVVLQTMDSAFVAGATTDAQGNFSLERLSRGDYRLLVSCIGYQSATLDLKGLERTTDVGEILLGEDAVALEGVTVSGSAQTTRSDRKLVFPSERQVKASRNGIELSPSFWAIAWPSLISSSPLRIAFIVSGDDMIYAVSFKELYSSREIITTPVPLPRLITTVSQSSMTKSI